MSLVFFIIKIIIKYKSGHSPVWHEAAHHIFLAQYMLLQALLSCHYFSHSVYQVNLMCSYVLKYWTSARTASSTSRASSEESGSGGGGGGNGALLPSDLRPPWEYRGNQLRPQGAAKKLCFNLLFSQHLSPSL